VKKYYLILTLIVLVFTFTGAGCNKNETTSTSSTTSTQSQTYSASEANKKLLEYAIVSGPKDSKVTIIEASDFECPACRHWSVKFKPVIDKYIDKIQFGYIAFPLNYHEYAMPAALAVEAAAKQSKGWELFNSLFEGQTIDQATIDAKVNALGLNMDEYNKDIASEELKTKIKNGMDLLSELGLEGTPTFYINGTPVTFNPTAENFEVEINKIFGTNTNQ